MNNENKTLFRRLPVIFTTLLLSGIGLVLFLLAGTVRPVFAVDCHVPGTYGTIQAAVDDTNCDTIIVAAGTYSENVVIDRSLALQGAGNSTVIDGAGTGRPVALTGSSVVVQMQDFRLTNGNATAASPNTRFGGGIVVAGGATLHGQGLQIDHNVASTAAQTGFGGGLAIVDGSAYLTNTVILSNTGNVRGPGLRGNGTGGGLYAAGLTGSGRAILHLADSEVKYNVANDSPGDGPAFAIGGGLRVGDSDNTHVTIVNTVWEGNMARGSNAGVDSDISRVGDGGAIAVNPTNDDATVTIVDSVFIGNMANASADIPSGAGNARGGAILADNGSGSGAILLTLTNVSFFENVAKAGSGPGDGQGGAIYARKSTVVINGGVMMDNVAARDGAARGQGGAIRLSGVDTTVLEAAGVTILNNVALIGTSGAAPGNDSQGGGIQASGSGAAMHVVNSILADNVVATSGGNGAGIYLGADATGNLAHLTIAAATLNSAHGIYHGPTGSPGNVRITNTIVAGHATGIHNQGFNGAVVQNYTLFYGNTSNTVGSVVGSVGNVEGDPAFVNPADGDYHITAGSAALNVGTDAGVMVDIDGDSRPQGAGFDIGADEFVPLVAPASVTISGPTSGVVNEPYNFTAVVSPPDTSQPITYTWSPAPVSGQGTATATYVWNTAGMQAIEVTVENEAGSAMGSHSITIHEAAIAPDSVTINGPASGDVDTAYNFTAVVSPPDATAPFTYTWSPAPDSGQGTSQVVYTWPTEGEKSVMVTVENSAGSATDSHTITITAPPAFKIFLPITLK